MPRNICVDVNIGKKSNINVDIDSSTDGKVPPFGLKGQVLTKTSNSYA